jgi:hypothetical protein
MSSAAADGEDELVTAEIRKREFAGSRPNRRRSNLAKCVARATVALWANVEQ